MMKWEYKEVYIDFYFVEQELNKLGQEGWELMSFDMDENNNVGLDYAAHKAIFKRRYHGVAPKR